MRVLAYLSALVVALTLACGCEPKREEDLIRKYVDSENGVVCYYANPYNAISCVKVKE